MKISEIYAILDQIAPFCDAESWDNSGLLIGSMDDEFDEIYLSLDLDSNLLTDAKPNSLFITHHPLIFRGLKVVNPTKYPANLLIQAVKKNIKLISAHTNFDKHALNRFVLNEILGYKEFKSSEFTLEFKVGKSFDEFATEVKYKFELETLRVVKACEFIQTAAFCTGSGADLIGEFTADCFLSGDFKYHAALESYENKLSLIDITHYASERYFGACMQFHLQKFGVFAKIAHSINPFKYI